MTREEWIKEGRAWYTKHKSLRGWPNRNWFDPESGEGWMLTSKTRKDEVKPADGSSYTPKRLAAQEKQVSNRKTREGAWKEELWKSVQKAGLEDRYEEFVKEIEAGLLQWKKDIAALNRKLPGGANDPLAVTRGHIKALANGGMDLPENIIREFKYEVDGVRGNLSRIASEDSPLVARMMAGAPENTDEWVIKRMLAEDGVDITRNQSHELREAILAAGDDTELIDDLIAKSDQSKIKPIPELPGNVGKNVRTGLSIGTGGTRLLDQSLNLGMQIDQGNYGGAALQATQMAAGQGMQSTAAQKQIAKILAKRGSGTALKLIPGVDVALSGAEAYGYATQGKWDQAGIAALSGAVGWIPVIGDAASAGLDLYNTSKDIESLYGKSALELAKDALTSLDIQ